LAARVGRSVPGYWMRESAMLCINEVSVSIYKLMQLLIHACVAYPTVIESNLLPIGQHESDRYEVFCRGTIRDRVRTAGIIGHHPADGAARMRGRIGVVGQPLR